MTHKAFLPWLLWTLVLVGCGAPRPPGWPSGEERPINSQQQGRGAR